MIKFYKLKEKIYYPVGISFKISLPAIKNMAKMLNKIYPIGILNLWVRGSSGAIISAAIAARLPKRDVIIYHVKKEGENAHDSSMRNLSSNIQTNIIVDDFSCTGTTINTIYKEFKDFNEIHSMDCICITQSFYLDTLDFIPKVIIANRVNFYENTSEKFISKTAKFEYNRNNC